MDSYTWSQIITLGLAIAVLVILIVVLARHNLTPSNNQIVGPNNVADAEAIKTSMVKADVKVNWLYGLAIAEAGIVVIFGVLTLLAMMRWSRK